MMDNFFVIGCVNLAPPVLPQRRMHRYGGKNLHQGLFVHLLFPSTAVVVGYVETGKNTPRKVLLLIDIKRST